MLLSDYTLQLLILGLLPVLIAVIQANRIGYLGFLSIRFLSIIFIWVGYHLSPWLAYLTGDYWNSFLLVTEFLDKGLLFSLISMFCVLLGSGWMSLKNWKSVNFGVKKQLRLRLPRMKFGWLIITSAISLILFIVNVGGLDEIWDTSYFRGEGQFNERIGVGKILQIISVLSTPLNASLACMASFAVLQEKNTTLLKITGYLALIVASLASIHSFSRGAGFSFVILAFMALRVKRNKGIVLAFVCAFVTLYLGSVGLNERSRHPGLGNFLDALLAHQIIVPERNKSIIPGPEKNSLDAIAPWTRKALAAVLEEPRIEVMGPRFLWNLQPFPSEFLPLAPLGRGLGEIMGTIGSSSNITTPALAELYYVFGMWGVLFMIPFGGIFSFFDRQTVSKPGLISTICLLLCFISLPIGLHSSMRAMTRPLLYALVIHFLSKNSFRPRLKGIPLNTKWKRVWNY